MKNEVPAGVPIGLSILHLRLLALGADDALKSCQASRRGDGHHAQPLQPLQRALRAAVSLKDVLTDDLGPRPGESS